MGAESLTADELIVEAEYFHPTGQEEPSLSHLHDDLRLLMQMEGYRAKNPQKAMLSPRSIVYIYELDPPEKTWVWKIKETIGLADERKLIKNTYLDDLQKTRDNLPFHLRFRTIPVELENEMGIRIEIKSEPAVLHKHQQIRYQEAYNTQNVIRTSKEKIEDIAIDMGWDPWREPHTTAEDLRETLDLDIREVLKETKYGSNITQLTDEGDESLRYHLLHSALGAYIHAIEWAIICYLEDVHEDDLIEEEQRDGFGYDYAQLVTKIAETESVTQKTKDDLERFVTDRRWMGHHKSGTLTEANVVTVKQRLEILLQELFL